MTDDNWKIKFNVTKDEPARTEQQQLDPFENFDDDDLKTQEPDTSEVAKEYAEHLERASPEAPAFSPSSPVLPPGCSRRCSKTSLVNHPTHYNQGTHEVIDIIEDWGLGFHAGNVVKYVSRHSHKGTPLRDLKKARWYLERLIELETEAAEVDAD